MPGHAFQIRSELDKNKMSVTSLEENNTINYEPLWAPAAFSVWTALTSLITIVGSFFFVLLLGSFFVNKKLQTGSGFLIFHLLIVELTICCFHYPIFIITVYQGHHRQALQIDCAYIVLMRAGTYHTANWSSVFLATNRFIATMFPYHYRGWASRRILATMIILSWVIGFGIQLPLFYGGRFGVVAPFGSCGTNLSPHVYNVVWAVVGAYLPILVEGLNYVSIFMKTYFLSRCAVSDEFGDGNPNRGRNKKIRISGQRRMIVAKMLFVSFIWYCLCFLPLPILTSFFRIDNSMLVLWLYTLLLVGYAANPALGSCANVAAIPGSEWVLRVFMCFLMSISPHMYKLRS